jgi:hypothetical protein
MSWQTLQATVRWHPGARRFRTTPYLLKPEPLGKRAFETFFDSADFCAIPLVHKGGKPQPAKHLGTIFDK